MNVEWGAGSFLRFLLLVPIEFGNGWLWNTIPEWQLVWYP